MKKLLLFAIALISCAAATAQTMPLPAHSSPFTGNVRGFYFVAPTCFTITGADIPTDAGTGNQSIAIVRFQATPPLYATTTNNFTVLFLVQNGSATGTFPLNIQVEQGDIIGVLGQRATINSYGTAGFVSNVGGFPTTLNRLGMQFPLTTTPPQQLWTENGGSISRVNLTYQMGINFTANHTVLNLSDVQFNSNADTSFTSVWDFGDGSPLATVDNPLHSYANGGTYNACTYITTSCGTDTICMSVTVCGSVATAAGYTSSSAGASAMFMDGSANATTWYWDFGDGNFSSSQNPTHTYATSGTYQVCQTAYNGTCDTATFCDSIIICITPTVSFSSMAIGGGTYMFMETSTEATSWSWDFGDGSPLGSGSNPSHTYAVSGTYVVCVTAYGCDSLSFCDSVSICVPPVAIYSYLDSAGTVQFTDMSSGSPTMWMWDFGDSATSTSQNPTHTYTANGIYNVCLISMGCESDTTCMPVAVCPEALTAGFTEADSGFVAYFTNGSSASAVSYFWDFGDSSTDTVANPVHTYTQTGQYTVCLTVWDICGDSVTTCDTVLIIILDVNAAQNVNVSLFPNPANQSAVLNVAAAGYSGNFVFEMYDAAGRVVRTQTGAFGTQMTIDRGELAAGLYTYKVTSDNELIGNGNLIFTE